MTNREATTVPAKPYVLVEGTTGAQMLPTVGDERAKLGAWSAYLCCSADTRRKHPVTYGALAADLFVVQL